MKLLSLTSAGVEVLMIEERRNDTYLCNRETLTESRQPPHAVHHSLALTR